MSRIEDLSSSVYESFAMLSGIQLDLFTHLAECPQTAEDLASQLDVRPDRLSVLCYALVAARLLTISDGRFSNTEESDRFLVRGKPEFLGERHQIWSQIWSAAMQTAESIRTDTPQARLDFGSLSDDERKAFFSGLHPGALAGGREFAAAHDFSPFQTMLDVGTGSGGFSLGLTEKWTHLDVTLVDLASITPVTRRFLEEADATNRIAIVAADLVGTSCPGELLDSFDVAVLKNFLQVLSPNDVQSALRHVIQTLHPGGRIYVTGHILDDTRTTPIETARFNLVFLNIYENGQAYTRNEYETWLSETGFADIVFLEDDLVTAIKPT